MRQLESSWHGRSVDHVLTYSERQIMSGFDAPIGVVLAWEERGSCLNIFRTKNRGQLSEKFTNYEAKDLLRNESNAPVRVVFANRSGFDAPIGVVLAWEELGSCVNIFRTTNRSRILETFMNYEAKDLLRSRLGIGGGWIMSSQIPDDKSRMGLTNLHELRGKRLVAQVSQTSRFALYLRTVVVLMHQLQSTWHGRSVDHVLTYSGQQIAVGSHKPSQTTRQKICCASQSNTSVHVVFANQSGFDAPIGVVLGWEERRSCLNIFRMINRGRISETFTNYKAKYLLHNESNTSVRVVFANRSGFDAPIGVVLVSEERGSCLNIFRMTNRGRIIETITNYEAKDLLRNESNTSIRVVFANRSGFHAPIGVVLAREERGSCLNILRMKNRGQISETFTNYEAKDLMHKNLCELRGKRLVAQMSQTAQFALYLRTGVVLMLQLEWSWHGRSVDHFLTYSGRQIASDLRNFTNYDAKDLLRNESNTSVRVVFANRSGFDAPIGVVLALEERGSCLNKFWMLNRGRISETFTNYEAKDLLCKSVRVVFANRSGFDASIGVFLAWEERGSCLNIFRTKNHGRISETFTNYEVKDLLRNESKTSVRVAFANRSGFDAPIGGVLAREERGSCLTIFWMTNHGRISETFTNHEAKDLLRK
ncbi:uncharacterized protein G2W53_041944 [Senna tora]|uniref:Uncharacterized protein n=1 Tax=Senna tora TaxID=362788 RepID=A0A834VYH8_9FABA|nr:uncharacterized protein G2W53_041944 [Senna tora]